MTRITNNVAAVGRPHNEARHRRIRAALSLVAALSGAGALLLVGFVVIGSVSLGDAAWAFIAAAVLAVIWLSGVWWRWDAPDARDRFHERERRGF